MNIQELLQSWLVSQYNSGKTDEELAEMAGCTRVHINRLRHGKFPMSKVKLETLLKLFPNLHVELGDSITAPNSAVNTGTNNGTMTVNNQMKADSVWKSALIAALSKSDMCDTCFRQVVRIIETL